MDTSDKPSLITRFSLFFVNNWRVSILAFLGISAVGLLSYTTLLKREGFPPIEVPVALVQTQYFVDDQNLVNEEVTEEIESAISGIEEVSRVSSTTADNFASIVVEFSEGTTSDEGSKLLKDTIQAEAELPEEAEVSYRTFNAGAFDGENDLIFSVTGEGKSIRDLQTVAAEIVDEVEKLSNVTEARVIEQIQDRTNPITGETSEERVAFGRTGYRTEDGNLEFRDAVLIGAVRNPSAGTIEFSESVQTTVQELKDDGELEGYQVVFGGGDLSNSLTKQIAGLETNALTGLIAVMLVLLLFVNWRASLIMAFFVPTVMLATFAGLYLIGYSLNTLSLFALILVIGIVADDAIVVIDAIDYSRKQGYKGKDAIIHAINNVGIADISGSITTILVFAPLAAVSGVLGEFIRLIPITVMLSLALSLVIGLSLVPFLGNGILPNYGGKKSKGLGRYLERAFYFIPRIIDWLNNLVYRFVHAYLKRVWASVLVILVGVGLIVGSFGFAAQLDFALFAPAKDTDEITVTLSLEDNEDINQAIATVQDVESIIDSEIGEFVEDVTYFESSASGSLLYVTLTPLGDRDVTSTTMVEDLNEEFANLEDAEVEAAKAGAGPPSDDFQVTLQVFADETEKLETVTAEIRDYVADLELESGSVEEVVVDNLDVIVKQDGRQFAAVKAKVSDPNDTQLVLDVQTAIQDQFDTDEFKEANDLDDDAIGFDLGQQGENLESFESAMFALVIAIVIMYSLLVLQFNSFTQPALILTAVPMAFPGLFPGLLATNNGFSFFVMVGIVGLVGIVVNNTILLLDFANSERKEKGIVEAMSGAIKARFRPLFTTSVTTLVGILPLALSDPFWEPLAFSIIFGLLSSTTMVILVFPVFYATLEHFRRFVWRKIFRQKNYR